MLMASPSPPPDVLDPEVSHSSSYSSKSFNRHQKIRPSQGDAVLIRYLDGGKRPDIAPEALMRPLARYQDDFDDQSSSDIEVEGTAENLVDEEEIQHTRHHHHTSTRTLWGRKRRLFQNPLRSMQQNRVRAGVKASENIIRKSTRVQVLEPSLQDELQDEQHQVHPSNSRATFPGLILSSLKSPAHNAPIKLTISRDSTASHCTRTAASLAYLGARIGGRSNGTGGINLLLPSLSGKQLSIDGKPSLNSEPIFPDSPPEKDTDANTSCSIDFVERAFPIPSVRISFESEVT